MVNQVAIRATLHKRDLVTFVTDEFESLDDAVEAREATKAAIRQPMTPANRVVQLIRELHPDIDVVVTVTIICPA